MSKKKSQGVPPGPSLSGAPPFGGSVPPPGEPWPTTGGSTTLENFLRSVPPPPPRPSMPWYAIGCASLGAALGGILGHWAENDPHALVEIGNSVKPIMSLLNPPTERADVLHLLSEMIEKKGPHQEAAKILHAVISSGGHSGMAEKAHRRQVRAQIRAQARRARSSAKKSQKKPIITPPGGAP